MTDQPHGAHARFIPLPEARRLKRAIDSLDTGINVHRGSAPNPMGERGEAAQLLGILKAIVHQIEHGLLDGPLHTQIQKGVFAGHERDVPALLAGEAARAAALRHFAAQGIEQVPHASQQMAATALAMQVAGHGFAAAAQIAVGVDSPDFNGDAVVKESEAMYAAADELGAYIARKRAEHGEA